MQDPGFRRQFQAQWLIDTYGAPAVRYFLVNTPYRHRARFCEAMDDDLPAPPGTSI